MFKKTLPFLAITLLIGLIAGCGGSSNPLAGEAQSNIKDQNYEAALQAAEKSIEKYPNDPIGYYYKGVALGEIAGSKQPDARQDSYKEMDQAFEQAKELASKMEEAPGEIENIDPVKNSLWRTEHNKAIEYAADDSVKKVTDQPLKLAISHLQNATTIIPDSVLSWDVLAQVNYMDKNVKGAISAMEEVIKRKKKPTADDYLRMSGYYRVNEQPEEAVEVLEEARKKFPKNEQIVQNLADAYSNSGDYDKSVDVVEKLIAQDPKNPQYHLVLGTQIYQSVLQLNEELKANYKKMSETQDKAEISKLEKRNLEIQNRVDQLTDKATEELKTVIKYRSNDAVAYNTLGVIYQNKAAATFEKRNRTNDNQEASKLDQVAKSTLKQSMEYYEKAANLDPDNKEYWKSLFSIYTTLGMDKKAEEAMKKAGM